MFESDEIKRIIPHREPFLLVDRIEELVAGEKAVGYLEVTGEGFWVRGHFPDYPVMPGVLIVEALAQVGAIAILSAEEHRGKLAMFAGIDKVRFRREVRPGDVLRLEVELTRMRPPVGFGEARATVGDEEACSGTLMFAVKEHES